MRRDLLGEFLDLLLLEVQLFGDLKRQVLVGALLAFDDPLQVLDGVELDVVAGPELV
jgi:hypothetical protein